MRALSLRPGAAVSPLSYEFYDTPAQKEAVRRAYAQSLATAVREHQVYLQEEELAGRAVCLGALDAAGRAGDVRAPSGRCPGGVELREKRVAPPLAALGAAASGGVPSGN